MRNLFITLVLLVSLVVAAQSSRLGEAQGSVNKESLDLLNKVSAIYNKSTGTQIELKIKFLDNRTGLGADATGTLKTAGRKFALTTTFATMIYDGTSLTVYDKKSNEITISSPTGDEAASVDPTAIMSMFKEGYKISAPEKDTSNSNLTVIKLYPEDRQADASMIEVTINTATYTPTKIATYGKNGVENSVELTKVEVNKQFPDETFEFDLKKHKSAILVDLR